MICHYHMEYSNRTVLPSASNYLIAHALLRRNSVIISIMLQMLLEYTEKNTQLGECQMSCFLSADRRLRQTGRFHEARWDAGRPCSVRNVRVVRQIFEAIEREPTISIRFLTSRTGIPHDYVHHALQEQRLYPYYIQSARVSTTESTCIYQQRRNCASPGLGSPTFTTNMCGQMKILMGLEHIQQWQISIKQWAGICVNAPFYWHELVAAVTLIFFGHT
jgi:hypothetical protein